MAKCICCGESMNVLYVPLHSKCQAQHYYWHMKGHEAEKCGNPTLSPRDRPWTLSPRDFKPTFKDSKQAFDEAVVAGHLTTDEGDAMYAGDFMYMYTHGGQDWFKYIDTRKYVSWTS